MKCIGFILSSNFFIVGRHNELTSHLKYLSTMSSFNNFHFKNDMARSLLADRGVTWRAFESLPQKLI